MRDQAERLRQIIQELKRQNRVNRGRTARLITVTSGKGGVGKTNFTINLALELRRERLQVLVFDADFGLANVDVLLGITPRYNLSHVINQSKSILDIIEEGPDGIQFISGGSGIQDLVHLKESQLDSFIEKMKLLDGTADVILVDTGAGLSANVTRLVGASDEVILVTTPEPTSIMDAYALVKVVSGANPHMRIRLLVNKAETVGEAEKALDNFLMVTGQFLQVKLEKLGYILFDHNVSKAVKLQSPFVLSYPNTSATRHMRKITLELLNAPPGEERSGSVWTFFRRFARGSR